MTPTSTLTLLWTLRNAREKAFNSRRSQYVYQLVDGEWHFGHVIPDTTPYLHIGPDDAASIRCADCERVAAAAQLGE